MAKPNTFSMASVTPVITSDLIGMRNLMNSELDPVLHRMADHSTKWSQHMDQTAVLSDMLSHSGSTSQATQEGTRRLGMVLLTQSSYPCRNMVNLLQKMNKACAAAGVGFHSPLGTIVNLGC